MRFLLWIARGAGSALARVVAWAKDRRLRRTFALITRRRINPLVGGQEGVLTFFSGIDIAFIFWQLESIAESDAAAGGNPAGSLKILQ